MEGKAVGTLTSGLLHLVYKHRHSKMPSTQSSTNAKQSQSNTSNTSPTRRKVRPCRYCRARLLRCDTNGLSSCTNCQADGYVCTYAAVALDD
ncbi:hypothetical protein C8R45DRAFT_1219675 [Mycena sanguinolenta]|nr:hypothetical protein C8R45DRAFT_1219675 [Mycena sanguinolenta]